MPSRKKKGPSARQRVDRATARGSIDAGPVFAIRELQKQNKRLGKPALTRKEISRLTAELQATQRRRNRGAK